VVEGDGLGALAREPLVQDVEELEERHVLADIAHLVRLEATWSVGPGLPPHAEREVHL
jgi:hypothetical protein